ncbi:DUF4430 domain-containing protein [Candidatus Nomurabacteria bacterium]|nr:DUF4430 domain-containing protein [Candidatus Nomurabacteria bacterium]
MNKKNIKILILVISSCILLAVFYQIGVKPLSKVEEEPQIPLETLSYKNIKVSLIIEDKKYEGEFKDGATVFEVMQKLKEENNEFDFKYTEHTGLGIFIDEMNGKKGGRDGYWIYYVNGKEASIGISNYKIKNGDIISWKYEK